MNRAVTIRAREKNKHPMLIAFLCMLSVVALAYGTICWIAASETRIFPNVYLMEQDMSLWDRSGAVQILQFSMPEYYERCGVDFTMNGETIHSVTLEELGVTIDVEKSVEKAWQHGREYGGILGGWHYIRSLLGIKVEIKPVWHCSDPTFQGVIQLLKERLDRPPYDSSHTLIGSQLSVTKGKNGTHIKTHALSTVMQAKILQDEYVAIPLTCETTSAAQADLQAILKEYDKEARDARYDIKNGTILPESIRVTFDVEQAKALLDLAQPGETVLIDAEVYQPQITAQQLQERLFRDVLGSYKTRVTGSKGRLHNVKLSARSCNGIILNPGDIFDYNTVVGPRTSERGYEMAPAYFNGKTVDEIGGGICQTSSTIYAAALHANLEIVSRTEHGFASSYIGLGLDATVSYSGPEFTIRNNTAYPVKIETIYDDKNNLTVNIYGTNMDGTYVEMETVTLSKTNYREQRIETTDLAPGVTRVEQTPYTGYEVETYRCVYAADGTLISRTFEAKSKYKVRNRIVLVGVRSIASPNIDYAGEIVPEAPVIPPEVG